MAIPTTQSTQMPLRSPTPLISHSSPFIHFRSLFFIPHRRTLYPIKHFCSLRTSTNNATTSDNRNRYPWDDNNNDPQNPTKNPNRSSSSVKTKPTSNSSSWIKKWPSSESNSKQSDERVESRVFDGKSTGTAGENAIQRIVLRLRNLGLGSDDEEEEEEGEGNIPAMPATGDEKLGDLLSRDWVRPDKMLDEDEDEESLLPWERRVEVSERDGIEEEVKKKRTASAPTLAELTIEDSELRRLRREGMTLRERISVAKAGVTGAVLEKIHDKWRKSELVRLKFHETLAHDMKTAHEIVERRTGGLITWRAGSVMVVYRGSNYNGPSQRPKPLDGEGDSLFVPDVSSADNTIDNSVSDSPSLAEKNKALIADRVKILTEEEVEYNKVLDGLGPRFDDWWGTGIVPVDADRLPPKVPGFKTPFRLLPTGMRSRLTNGELTNLRKLARSLPCHFALGRNRNHQGLAEAIIKLWEQSLVVKIAVKRGIQNTNNKLMADEIKDLTGGILLLRNKFFIVIYRGKDFVPTTVATALAERQEITKQIQDTEEKVRSGTIKVAPPVEDTHAQAGTLAEFYEAQARWGKEVSNEEREKMIEEASRIKNAKKFKTIEHKLSIARSKLLRAEKMLSKVEASMVPVGPSDDQETITEEERSMFRRVGLRMKAYLPMGIRGVFDGVIENMHLHWKHRELVKLISKQKNPAFIEETARLLEYESGGILVAIERVPKGHALIYYRGKNYRRPISLRPRNLLTKAKALKRSVALQRHEALSQHISEVEKTIEQMKLELGYDEDVEAENSGDTDKFKQASELDESEDEWINSDDEEDDDDDDSEDEESISLGLDDHDYPPGRGI